MIRAFLEAFKALWSVLTELGVTQAILSLAASAGLTIWSLVQGAPTSLLAFIAVTAFCAVFVFFNSVRFIWREYKQYPDYVAWDRVEDLAIWQIACLWAQQKPYAHLNETTKAYPYLQALKVDQSKGRFSIVNPEADGLWQKVTREELRKYAEKKGEKPPFLYPGER